MSDLTDRLHEAQALPVITHRWLNECRTAGGGWTRGQIEAMGITWPPSHGWQHRLVGTRISAESRVSVEQQADETVKWVDGIIDLAILADWPQESVDSLCRCRDARSISLQRWRGVEKRVTPKVERPKVILPEDLHSGSTPGHRPEPLRARRVTPGQTRTPR